MKIVVISSWFSEKMGYSENFFPKALAQLGHDVHVITSTAQVYYNSPTYTKTYFKHLGPAIVDTCVKQVDGFTLHRLAFTQQNTHRLNPFSLRGIRIHNLIECLERISPDIIQVINSIDEPPTYDAAIYAKMHNKVIFTESHQHASVMRKNNKKDWKERLRSFVHLFHPQLRTISQVMAICYPIAPDAADIVQSLYHVPKSKIKIQSLGVDTDLFCPATTPEHFQEREQLRASLGFKPDELVCIYTGRFSLGKNPQLLAEAVHRLRQRGEKVSALFMGNGTESEIESIRSKQGCIVHPFVFVRELPKYYRAADIGVWPREESTSQLDAAACGLPLILSNAIQVTERVAGNGYLYKEGDVEDLGNKICQMKDSAVRNALSIVGSEKVRRIYSWIELAAQRVEDYRNFLPKI
jgi:glycosyltransferase involved in cell wall biosynthesis